MQEIKVSTEGSSTIYIIKALALLGIVSAHCAGVLPDAQLLSQFFSCIVHSVGAVGVGVFFFISGFLYRPVEHKETLGRFLKKRGMTLFVPWAFCASLVYLYVAVRKGGTVIDWLLSIVGYMSSYWYMTVLVALYFIYYFIYRKRGLVICSMAISIVSAIVLECGFLQRSAVSVYLNPLNWMVFFAVGILLQSYAIEAITDYARKRAWLSIVVVFVAFTALAKNGMWHTYFSILYIPLEIISIISILSISGLLGALNENKTKLITYIGKRSFSIYLLHELGFAGLITWIFNKFDLWWTIPIRPILVVALTAGFIEIGYWIAEKIHIKKVYAMLIGGRK